MIPGVNMIIKDPMVSVIQNAIDKIANDLDIICIMENIQELSKLKKVLLTRE